MNNFRDCGCRKNIDDDGFIYDEFCLDCTVSDILNSESKRFCDRKTNKPVSIQIIIRKKLSSIEFVIKK